MAERFEIVEKTLLRMLESKKYTTLRDILITMNPSDVAGIFNDLEEKQVPLMFRLLPKELAAETFVEMESDTHVLKSGKTVIQHIYDTHFEGAEMAAGFLAKLEAIQALLPEEAYARMHQRLTHQAGHAKDWRDIINTYFHRISDIDDQQGRTIYE